MPIGSQSMLDQVTTASNSASYNSSFSQPIEREERWVAPQTKFSPPAQWRNAAVRITRGCLIVSHELGDGRRQIVDVLGAHRVLSCETLARGVATAHSLTFTRIERLDPQLDQETIEEAHRVALRRAYGHALLLGRKKSMEKVATALLDLAEQFARSTGSQIRPSFTLYLMRSELADWLGLTLETVSRCLSEFKRKGLIAFERTDRMTICEMSALRAIADGSMPST